MKVEIGKSLTFEHQLNADLECTVEVLTFSTREEVRFLHIISDDPFRSIEVTAFLPKKYIPTRWLKQKLAKHYLFKAEKAFHHKMKLYYGFNQNFKGFVIE